MLVVDNEILEAKETVNFQAIVPFYLTILFWEKVFESEVVSITIYMIISSVGFCFDFAKLHVLDSEYRFFSCYKKLKVPLLYLLQWWSRVQWWPRVTKSSVAKCGIGKRALYQESELFSGCIDWAVILCLCYLWNVERSSTIWNGDF